jgi:UDPglucose 6-dehydrogenase
MKKQSKIAIVGYGYVGQAVGEFFKSSFELVVHDPALKKGASKARVNECDLAIVCVPTPMKKDGSVDLSIIENVLGWLKTPLVVIKSTVPPGTTARLAEGYAHGDVAFSPEFIGEGKYPVPYWQDIPHPTDMSYHSFHIFGGKASAANAAIEYWNRAAGPFARFITTDATAAELTKYMENAWIATKITFVNEFYDIANAFGVNFNELRELWLLDGRVGRSHTLVYEKKRGFDGKCIPKDTNGIVAAAKARGYTPSLLDQVLATNAVFVGKH